MNQRSTRTSWRQVYIALIATTPCSHAWGLAAGQAAAEESVADQIDAAIRHAKTYYLLSVTEQGDVPASQAGLRELEHAEELLKQGNFRRTSRIESASTSQPSRAIWRIRSRSGERNPGGRVPTDSLSYVAVVCRFRTYRRLPVDR